MIHLQYLNGPDIERLALSDGEILDAVERALDAQGNKAVVIEPRMHLVPHDSAHGHFNVLRGVVHPLGLAGVKVVGDFVDDFKLGLPSEPALLNLFDPSTGVPKAILNATSLTDMRTGAMTALAASIWRARPARYSDISARAARLTGISDCSTISSISTKSACIRGVRRAATNSRNALSRTWASRWSRWIAGRVACAMRT